jgi:hypothetical protein
MPGHELNDSPASQDFEPARAAEYYLQILQEQLYKQADLRAGALVSAHRLNRQGYHCVGITGRQQLPPAWPPAQM